MSKSPLDYVFFGTDEFATGVLTELATKNFLPSVIVTTPDAVAGKHNRPTPPPVKVWAQARGIPLLQPSLLSANLLSSVGQPTIFVVASYGRIIPPEVLAIPRHGVLNIHPSLLPRYRGPSPLQAAILNDDTETGVSIMLLDEQMDHGPLLATKKIPLHRPRFELLRDQLACEGARLLVEILPAYLSGALHLQEQDHSQATYTKKINKEDGRLDLQDGPKSERQIRALNPNPGTYLIEESGRRLKVLSAHLENNILILERVIPSGKKEMDWESYRRGKK